MGDRLAYRLQCHPGNVSAREYRWSHCIHPPIGNPIPDIGPREFGIAF